MAVEAGPDCRSNRKPATHSSPGVALTIINRGMLFWRIVGATHNLS